MSKLQQDVTLPIETIALQDCETNANVLKF